MITITIGLQEFHQNNGPDWDEDVCSDLVNQIGKRFEQIGRLDDPQKTDVLMRAQSGGFIRWHILSADQRIISSTHRDGCMNVFAASITMEACSGVMAIVLETTQLRADLEQLRKLKRSQVADIWYGLEYAGFVERSQVQEAIQDSTSPANRAYIIFEDTDVAQPFPSLFAAYLPTSDPRTPVPSNNIPPTCIDPDLWMSDIYSDWLLGTTETPDASQLFMAPETISVGTPLSIPGMVSPAVTINTLGLDGSASSYSTPSTICFDSPQMGERTLPGVGATMLNRSVKRKRLDSDLSMPSKITAVVTESRQTILYLLQSCAFYEADEPKKKRDRRVRKILEAQVQLSVKDPCRVLRPLLSKWNDNMSLELHALGLPTVWKGIEGAVNYIHVLDTHATTPFLDPVAERIGQVLLYFNYEDLCSHPQEHSRIPMSKPVVTFVLNSILNSYSDDPRKSMPMQSRRDRISGYHVRRGRWWWKLAGTLGVGILLIGDSSLMNIMCNDTFSNDQINALVTFASHTRPGTIRIFHALERVVKSLMFGQVSDDLRAILNDESGFLGQNELARAHVEDETAIARQRMEHPWTEIDTEKHAGVKMQEFLSRAPET
ncbi:conserved serine-proline rich protein [Aspergillus luchuensis IFO 4308]|nr:conserved serine-proline rich protein [Aspergillus luchuensis IFO 4308]